MNDDLSDADRLQAHLEKVKEKSRGYKAPRASIPENERPPDLPPNPEPEGFNRRYGSDA